MKLFAGLEADGFAGRDADFGAGSGIAADAGFARTNAEDAEAAQFDAIACCQSLFEALEDSIHGSFRLGPRQACSLDDVMHDILLDQCPSPSIEENLAPMHSGWPEWPTGEMLLGVGRVVNPRILQHCKDLESAGWKRPMRAMVPNTGGKW
jgi:hypothetical protein